MNKQIFLKSVIAGLALAAITAAVSWVWLNQGQDYYGLNGLIIGMFSGFALIVGFLVASVIGLVTSTNLKNKTLPLIINGILLIVMTLIFYRIMFYAPAQPMPESDITHQLQAN